MKEIPGSSSCSTYSSLLQRKEWFRFREKCIAIAGGACERCGRSQREVSLQVHHPHYGSGLMPWEYDTRFCEVLCKGCHASEHGKTKPLEGWTLVHSDWDNGSPTGDTHCEHCGEPMKWHNDLWHPDWGVITVGYECAENLGNTEVRRIKRAYERINTFIFSPRWKKTPKGWKYRHGERNIFVMEKHGKWILNISGVWGRIKYETLNDAKERAIRFLLESGQVGQDQ